MSGAEQISMSFGTIELNQSFINPSSSGSDVASLHTLIRPHIDSFNSIFDDGLLDAAVADLDPRDIFDSNGNSIKFWFEDISFQRPLLPDKQALTSANPLLYPNECRERGVTYQSKLTGRICWMVNNSGAVKEETRSFGFAPVMLKSNRCHLESLSAAQLTAVREEAEELGGYFIVNGVEKLIRLLIVNRRNYPMALKRQSMASRGPLYTEYGVQIRCVRPDQTSQTLTMHYLSDGNLMIRFSYRKAEYLVPLVLILKALVPNVTDKSIYIQIIQQDAENTFLTGRVEMMLRSFRSSESQLRTQQDCLEFLGERFRPVFTSSDQASNAEIGNQLIKTMFLVHLNDPSDKFNLFILMARKVYALVAGQTIPDSPDSPQHHEILLSGHLYLGYLKERLDSTLHAIKAQISNDLRKGQANVNFLDDSYFKRVLQRASLDVGRHLQFFLATGNLNTRTGMDLQQVTGYTVVAERLNFLRFLAHFRSFHRGAFFTTMKNTDIRKLRPEQWGFACPVHTPDGPSCGLLSHLTYSCRLVAKANPEASRKVVSELTRLLVSYGAVPYIPGVSTPSNYHPVLIDGCWVALVTDEQITSIAQKLRLLRSSASTDGSCSFLEDCEIAAIPVSYSGTFPGLFLFTAPSRMLRPVRNLQSGACDYIGTLEQLHLNIALTQQAATPSHSHVELAVERMLSIVAGITPFSNYNQSPRNMYQCQMAKQTIGTPVHSHPHRCDSKLYRLYTGQAPIVRPRVYNNYSLDSYPNGTNAVVAVISYTSYDMEDAMILNKSSFERGFANAAVYKSEFYDLTLKRRRGERVSYQFSNETDSDGQETLYSLDMDGLPHVGQWVNPGDPVIRYVDVVNGSVRYEKWHDFEPAIIDQVRLISSDPDANGNKSLTSNSTALPLQRVQVKFRIPRAPVIGDKFASRHGQKGVCSQRWPAVDMPFSEQGIVPDIIINPHAFPSRMTIGMLLESMAAKSGAMMGVAQDATSFLSYPPSDENLKRGMKQKLSKKKAESKEANPKESKSQTLADDIELPAGQTASEYFGSQLKEQGFNYYGNEPLYSGITGELLRADIYFGIVYYQRLRHMVGDKFQVRTTGPVHDLTRQPIKGRQRAGGIRFGEMERDALIAHGAAYLLQDRLVNCSDYSQCYICTKCNSFLPVINLNARSHDNKSTHCSWCNSSSNIDIIAIPFVFRYLVTELMAMNIDVKIRTSQ